MLQIDDAVRDPMQIIGAAIARNPGQVAALRGLSAEGGAMTIKTAFVVQPFAITGSRSRRLVPLPKRKAQSEEHALHQAEHLATRRAGAAALALTVDTASGTMRGTRVLACFGKVPDHLRAP